MLILDLEPMELLLVLFVIIIFLVVGVVVSDRPRKKRDGY